MALLPNNVAFKEKGIEFALMKVKEAFDNGVPQVVVEGTSQEIVFCKEVEYRLYKNFPIESIKGTREKLVVKFTSNQERVNISKDTITLPEILESRDEVLLIIINKITEAHKSGYPQLIINGNSKQIELCSSIGVLLYRKFPITTLTWTKTKIIIKF